MTASAQPRVVHEFELEGRGTLRSCLTEFRGRTYVDVRLWVKSASEAELVPTRKGLSVPTDYLDEVQEAVSALAQAVKLSERQTA